MALNNKYTIQERRRVLKLYSRQSQLGRLIQRAEKQKKITLGKQDFKKYFMYSNKSVNYKKELLTLKMKIIEYKALIANSKNNRRDSI